jgi:hypothetical protein
VLEGCLGRIVMANSFATILPVAPIIVADLFLICWHGNMSCQQNYINVAAFDHKRHLPPNINTMPLIRAWDLINKMCQKIVIRLIMVNENKKDYVI